MSIFTKYIAIVLILSFIIGFSYGWNLAAKGAEKPHSPSKSEEVPPYTSPLPSEFNVLSTTFSSRQHWDLVCNQGTELRAPCDGIIVKYGYDDNGRGGNFIVLVDTEGRWNSFCHLRATNPTYQLFEGKQVKQGDLIGYTGMTGTCTGPCLHWMISKNGVKINPRTLVGGRWRIYGQ